MTAPPLVATPGRRAPWWDWIPLALALALFLVSYHFWGVTDPGYDAARTSSSLFRWIARHWEWARRQSRGGDFVFGWAVPLMSLWLVGRRWRVLAALPQRASGWGLAVIAASVFLHWAGLRTEQSRLSGVSLVGLAWGIPLLLFGPAVGRRLALPCGLLVLALPINFLDVVSMRVGYVTASLAAMVLNGLGFRAGNSGCLLTFVGEGRVFDTADAFSGVRGWTLLLLAAVAAAEVCQPTWRRKAAAVAAFLPIGLAANLLRVVAVGAAACAYPRANPAELGAWLSPAVYLATAAVGLWLVNRRRGYPVPDGAGAKSGWAVAVQKVAHPACVPHRVGLPSFAVLAAAVVSLALGATYRPPEAMRPAGLRLPLPARAGTWAGKYARYCQKIGCERTEYSDEPGRPATCPACGSPMASATKMERDLVPADTEFDRVVYARAGSPPYHVIAVVGGRQRASIHRPEACLASSQMTAVFTHAVPRPGRPPLQMRVLELVDRSPAGDGREVKSFFAYTFLSEDRETPNHLVRMFWTAWERLAHNRAQQWAYVAILGPRDGDRAYLADLDDLAAALDPLLAPRA